MSALVDSALWRLSDLSPEYLGSFSAMVEAEIVRLQTPETRRLAPRSHVQIVLSEAWLAHLDELYVHDGCADFCGGVSAYVERLAVDAALDIHDLLTASVLVWRPGMQRPRRFHRAVVHLVDSRVRAHGGGCELCPRMYDWSCITCTTAASATRCPPM
jgi:hypothetical protein